MEDVDSVNEIKERYLLEQGYISHYVDFATVALDILSGEIAKFLRHVDDHGLLATHQVVVQQMMLHKIMQGNWDNNTLEYIQGWLRDLVPTLQEAHLAAKTWLGSRKMEESPRLSKKVDNRINDSVAFLLEHASRQELDDTIDARREELILKLKEDFSKSNTPVAQLRPFLSIEAFVDHVVDTAKFQAREHIAEEIAGMTQVAQYFDTTLRMAMPNAEIHVPRQGFILLMTMFDATVGDLAEKAFETDFFHVLGGFVSARKNTKDEISYSDLARAGSFEEFRKGIIDSQLKGKYVTEILRIFNNLGAQLTDTGAAHHWDHLAELIRRRNVHIHHRGYVDSRYLNFDKQGKPQGNIYNFQIGDFATIDANYWKHAAGICEYCIVRLANWIEALSNAPANKS